MKTHTMTRNPNLAAQETGNEWERLGQNDAWSNASTMNQITTEKDHMSNLKKQVLVGLATAFVVLSLAPTTRGGIITGVTIASYSSQLVGPGDNRAAVNAVNGSGLTGTPGSQSHAPYSGTGNMWLTDGTAGAPWLVINLTALYTVEKFQVWNYTELGNSMYVRGLKDVTISTSSDNVTYTSQGTFSFAEGPYLPYDSVSYPATDTFTLATPWTNSQYIRLDVTSNWGDADYSGLAEIQFSGAVPEPATMALLALGGLLVLRRHRKG